MLTGFTDIHCHIIPGVDDGARDMEHSMKMLHILRNEGVRTVIATVHHHPPYMETDLSLIRERFNDLCAQVNTDEVLKGMNLYLGSEIYWYPSVMEWLDEGRILTLAGSDYILLEFSNSMDIREMEEAVMTIRTAGYNPVIAHAERYENLIRDVKSISELIERGAYIQINCEALWSGHRTRSFVRKLLEDRKVHFLATDAHNTSSRAPYVVKAAQYVEKRYGESYLRRLLIDNPTKLICNEFI